MVGQYLGQVQAGQVANHIFDLNLCSIKYYQLTHAQTVAIYLTTYTVDDDLPGTAALLRVSVKV